MRRVLPLAGVTVLDFSTLLPGPLAGLMLAEAGATVIKIERPSSGDEMRSYEPRLGEMSANFAILNRGKRSIAIDLKANDALAKLTPLIEKADVLLEQFRPGVMDRLGLGYAALDRINPRLIYCSVSGFGQAGPRRDMAGHDLNYLALSGLLSLTADDHGAPGMPHTPLADIAAGSYPAVVNVLLALLQRERTGLGGHLDISMSDNLFVLAYWALAQGFATGEWPKARSALTTGGSPRYGLYRTKDGLYLAAGPIEQRFWDAFCDLIGLDPTLRDDRLDPEATRAGVAARIAAHPAEHWREAIAGKDVCCALVATTDQALLDSHTVARDLFRRRTGAGPHQMPALPVPIVEALRDQQLARSAPELGADNALLVSTS